MVTVHVIETPALGDRSYVATDGTAAVVVDPQRDIDRILSHPVADGDRLTTGSMTITAPATTPTWPP